MPEPQQTPERGALTTRWMELITALVILAIGVLVIYDSHRVGVGWAEDGPRSGYFPNIIGWILAMAGLWAVWKDPTTGLWVPSAAVTTTAANRLVGTIHDRMPVLLPREVWDDWLDRSVDDEAYLLSLLEPAPDDVLEMTPISTKVNDVRNQGPELLEPVTLPDVPGATAPADEETPTLGLVS